MAVSQVSSAHHSNVLATVSVLKNEILAEMNDKHLAIKVREDAEKHIHTFLEYKGKVSLGYHAEMPQFRNRLTK
jgi:hypothetical protein